jgi:hypothetical protein
MPAAAAQSGAWPLLRVLSGAWPPPTYSNTGLRFSMKAITASRCSGAGVLGEGARVGVWQRLIPGSGQAGVRS